MENIKCKVCGFDYNRIEKIELYIGANDDYESPAFMTINDNGSFDVKFPPNSVTPFKTTHRSRGLMVEIYWVCEAGHRYSETAEFHKGITYTQINGLD